jgi:hypothetical protein
MPRFTIQDGVDIATLNALEHTGRSRPFPAQAYAGTDAVNAMGS